MNILQVVPSLIAGGAERAVLDVSAALVRAGHHAYVASAGGPMQEELARSGATHITIPVDTKNPIKLFQNISVLENIIREHKIDVVHVRSRAPAWSVFFACRRMNVPMVTTIHAAYKGKAPWKKLYNGIMAKADYIITVSDFIADYIRENYRVPASKLTSILRGIDFGRFDQAAVDTPRRQKFRHEHDIQSDLPLIIMPGRLSPIKGQELFLRALAPLRDEAFQALIIGPDQGRSGYRKMLEELIVDLRLTEKVKLVERTDLMAAYACADLVVSTSQVAEGFGRVPVEAQAFGVPVIATALGATSETVLDGETGWLVPVNDEKALTYALKRGLGLSGGERGIMAAKAVSHVRSRFDMRSMCADTIALYEKAAGRNKPGRKRT